MAKIQSQCFSSTTKLLLVSGVVRLLNQNGFALAYADDSLKKDKEIVLEAVKQDSDALYDADKSLEYDLDILAIINKKK